MDRETKQSFIRERARRNSQDPHGTHVLWSRHAITELAMGDLGRQSVEQALQNCELVADYAALHRPLPDCLVVSWLTSGDAIHAVIGIDIEKNRILVITVYRPSKEEWRDDWRTRKT